ncbi:MAG TPA: hypothetical protein VN519_17725 [Bryobacteraceae bacterium]|nr:hypothetical protein [Bryobacteraceae bacterium]
MLFSKALLFTISSLPILSCSPSNNLLLGHVEATAGSHKITVTDCYRTAVPPPEKSETPAREIIYRFAPCRDAVVVISGAELIVNGKHYGPLGPNDGVLVDHSVVSIERRP